MNGPYLQVWAVFPDTLKRRRWPWKTWLGYWWIGEGRWTTGREDGPAIIYQDGSQWWSCK